MTRYLGRMPPAQSDALADALAGLTPAARTTASVWHTSAKHPNRITLYYDTRSGTVTNTLRIDADGTTQLETRTNL